MQYTISEHWFRSSLVWVPLILWIHELFTSSTHHSIFSFERLEIGERLSRSIKMIKCLQIKIDQGNKYIDEKNLVIIWSLIKNDEYDEDQVPSRWLKWWWLSSMIVWLRRSIWLLVFWSPTKNSPVTKCLKMRRGEKSNKSNSPSQHLRFENAMWRKVEQNKLNQPTLEVEPWNNLSSAKKLRRQCQIQPQQNCLSCRLMWFSDGRPQPWVL